MILYELKNKIGHITIYSGKGNMLDYNDIESFLKIVNTTQGDDNVSAILITGSNNCFSTGLKASDIPKNEFNSFFAKFDKLLLELFSYPKPVVAMIDGHSIGGGLLLQCCADYVVAVNNPKIKIGLPELSIGLTIDELMADLITFNTGNVKVLQQLLYQSTYINVRRAMEIGFIDCVTESPSGLDIALAEINRLANYDQKAFQVTKRQLRSGTIQRMNNAMDNECYRVFKELK